MLKAVDQGYPRAEIVKLFGVSLASIKRYLKQRKETGDVSPRAIPGRPSKKYAALEAGLVAQFPRDAQRVRLSVIVSKAG